MSFQKIFFRMGNATWPKFDEDRARVDVVITKRDGVDIVIANGFSAFDHLTKIMKKSGKSQKKGMENKKGSTNSF